MALKPSLKHVKELALNNKSCFRKVDAEIPLMIHPMYASDLKNGVISELEQMMNRSYSKRLNGVPVYYENVQLLSQMGWIFGAEPFIHIPVRATFHVFSPELGVTLKGVVKKASVNHIGCLVHGLFNVSVLRNRSDDTEQWCGDRCREGDEIDLIVTSLDVAGYVPHILARIVPESIPVHKEEKVRTSSLEKPEEQQNRHIVFNDEDSGISTTDSTESPEHHGKTKKKSKRRASVSSTNDSTEEGRDRESRVNVHSVKSTSEDLENQNTGGSGKSKVEGINQTGDNSVISKVGKNQASVKDGIEIAFIIGSDGKPLKVKKKDKKGTKKDLSNPEDFSGNTSISSDKPEFKNVTAGTVIKEDGYQKHKKKKKDKDRKKKNFGGLPKEDSMDFISDISRLFDKEESKAEKKKKSSDKRKSAESGLFDSSESCSKSSKTLNTGMKESKVEKTKKSDKKRKSSESGLLDCLESSKSSKTLSSRKEESPNPYSSIVEKIKKSDKKRKSLESPLLDYLESSKSSKTLNSRKEESPNPHSVKGIENIKVKKEGSFLESISEAHSSHSYIDKSHKKKKKKKKSLEKIADLATQDELLQSPGEDLLSKIMEMEKKNGKSSGKKSSSSSSSEGKKKHSIKPHTSKFSLDDSIFDDLPFIG